MELIICIEKELLAITNRGYFISNTKVASFFQNRYLWLVLYPSSYQLQCSKQKSFQMDHLHSFFVISFDVSKAFGEYFRVPQPTTS